MKQHWLYKIIPEHRDDARGWRWITWALFGNDEDGIAGERDWYRERAGAVVTWGTFWRWWVRNPMHNLFWDVLAWRPSEPYALVDRDAFSIYLKPLFVYWRTRKWEGYIGWRPHSGALGAAIRRA
jgi:hypothetical protein